MTADLIRPETTLLYQIVDRHYPDFLAQLAAEGKWLPDYVQQEFTEIPKCGLLKHGFMQHIHVLHPYEGSLRLCKSAFLPICPASALRGMSP